MLKLLLLALLVAAVVAVLRGAFRGRSAPATLTAPEPIVACAHCGLLLPVAETWPATQRASGRVFCSEAHRTADESAAAS